MKAEKNIALIAHDNKKYELINWLKENRSEIAKHQFFATGTTGKLIEKELQFDVNALHSGPLGGDQQIGALIAEGKIDLLIFFWDPLQAMPHDSDVKALIRLAAVWNIPVACNESTADFVVSSPYFNAEYQKKQPEFNSYQNRSIPQ